MDDIAKNVGVSKKTIYQHYKDKNDIIGKVVVSHFQIQKEAIENATANVDNCIEELFEMSKCMQIQTANVNPAVLYDLERYYPKAYAEFVQFKDTFILNHIRESLSRGIEEGYFRPDINVEIIARLRLAQVQMTFNMDLYPREQFNFQDIHIQLFRHFAFGLLTDNGRVLFKHYFDEEHEA